MDEPLYALRLHAAYAPKPGSLDITQQLAQASRSEKDNFSFTAGFFGSKQAYVGTSGQIVISDSRPLLRQLSTGTHPQLKPMLLSWALVEPASLEWVVDEAKLPSGFAMRGAVVRHKTHDACLDYSLSGVNAAARQVLNKLIADSPFTGFALLTSDFQISSGDIVNMHIDWDG